MSVAIITGSAGLVGSEAVGYFSALGMQIVGIDNGMRKAFFGESASTQRVRDRLVREVPGYVHFDADIRNSSDILRVFQRYKNDVSLVIHTAAQPSHDWAASDPLTDFTVNANGTSVLLEATRKFSPDAVFIFTSTNKVYGDTPNRLPLVEEETRWEIDKVPPLLQGWHSRDDVGRSHASQSIRGFEDGGRPVGTGIWKVLRDEDRVLQRRMPHWPESLRNEAAWFSGLSDEMRGHRTRPIRCLATKANRFGTTFTVPT